MSPKNKAPKPALSSTPPSQRAAPADSLPSDKRLARFWGSRGDVLTAQEASRLFDMHTLRRGWLAIKRAGGGAGIDGETLAAFEANLDQRLDELRAELIDGSYKPRPLQQILVLKRSGGLRPLLLWAIRDRVAQRVVYDIISPLFEQTFAPCSFGFRAGLGVEDAVKALATLRAQNRRWVMNADIRQCFDEIEVERLQRLVFARVQDPLLRRYIDGWLRARILTSADGGRQHETHKAAGASQGSVLSPLLANIYLHEFDLQMTQQGAQMLRYADDIVVCCQRKVEAEQALAQVQQALAAIHLSLNLRKTHVTHFDQGFAWLGYFFVGAQHYRIRA